MERVTAAHTEVEQEVLSTDSDAHSETVYPGCDKNRMYCWLQIRHVAARPVCKYRGDMTESVAATLAIGP